MEGSLDKKGIRKDILKLGSPVFIEVLLGTSFGMVDMIMLGRAGDVATSTASIAAVGITNQVVFIGLSLVQALNTGATAMVARYLGAKRTDKIESIVKHIIILTQIFLVLPIFLIGQGFTTNVMSFIGAQADVISIGNTYFRVILIGFIFQAFNFSLVASLRGAGDTKTPMRINITTNLLNVFGNAILIYGLLGFPALGVTGAAVSTAICHVIGTILIVRHVRGKDTVISLSLKNKFKFDKDVLYNLVKIGLPASLEQVALRAGILMFTRIVASLGTVAYATHQIGINILSLSFTPGQAFGIAASTLTGRSLGEEKPSLAQAYINQSMRIGVVISLVMSLVFFFFGPYVAMLYTNSTDVVEGAGNILKLMALIMPFQGSQLITAGGLRGAGDTVWTLITTFIGILGIRLVLAYVFIRGFGMGLEGAWYAILADQVIRWFLIRMRFKTGKWKYVTIR